MMETCNSVRIHDARKMKGEGPRMIDPLRSYYFGRTNGQSEAWNICLRCTRKSTKCVAVINVRRSFKTNAVNAHKLAHEKFPESLFPAGADSAP
jgi:hypothetical protein